MIPTLIAVGLVVLPGLVIIAISLSLTFVLASPLNTSAEWIYERLQSLLDRFESGKRLSEEM